MSVCWWCHWGWPKPIADIYDAAVEQLGGDESVLKFGPAHVVWSDENWDCAKWCLDQCDKQADSMTPEEIAVVRWSLEQLLLVPDAYKDVPTGYDGVRPENYPPPDGWVMVPR